MTMTEYANLYVKWLKASSDTCSPFSESLSGLDMTGLDEWDRENLRQYQYLMGNLLKDLCKKQEVVGEESAVLDGTVL